MRERTAFTNSITCVAPRWDDRSIAKKGDRGGLEDLDISCRNLISRPLHPTYGRGASALLLSMGLGGSSNSVVVEVESQSRLI